MRQGTIFSICLSLTVLLAIGFSQERLHDPEVAVVKQRLEGFLPQVIASLTARYQLDAETGVRLGQSIRKAVASALQQPNVARGLTVASSTHGADGNLLELLLAQPPCRAAFARHLSPAQLQDYVEFINGWGRRGRQAAARRMTAWLDGQLLLSSPQRQQVEQLLVRSTQEDLGDLLWSEPAATQPLNDIHGRASFLSRLSRQSGKQLTEILSPAQIDLWRLLATPQQAAQQWWDPKKVENEFGAEKEDQRVVLFRKAQAEIQHALQEGVITRQQAQQKLAVLKRQLFEEEDEDEDEDADEDQERLGTFRQGQLKIERAVKAGELTRKQAARELAALQRAVFGGDEEEEADWLREDERGLSDRDRDEVYEAAQAALEQAVQAGLVARDQVAPRLAALKARLWRDDEGEERPDDRDLFQRAADEIEALVEAGRLTREEAEQRLGGLKKQLWADKGKGAKEDWWGEQKSSRWSGRERAQQIAQARLALHTAQLGPLDARASRRLKLAAKGILQQQFETGVRPADQVPATVRRQPDDEDRSSGRAAAVSDDVIQHPLYQRTLRRFLSADVLARDQAQQASRKSYQTQALRQLAVAVLDAHLLLDDPQRRQIEAAAGELPLPRRRGRVPASAQLFSQLSKRAQRASLRPEQQQRLQVLCRELKVDDEDFDRDEK